MKKKTIEKKRKELSRIAARETYIFTTILLLKFMVNISHSVNLSILLSADGLNHTQAHTYT